MDQGVSSVEACRIVGINRRTGKRWRNGRQAVGPSATDDHARAPPAPAGLRGRVCVSAPAGRTGLRRHGPTAVADPRASFTP
ncbi:helix-turn-helix domain-containing protein [Streptomyces sp. NPDC004609]|uniref:helix-turn-helix domain-containing protein n=1 Tax=Streptomyces sp. NPDC004609 TaxID=3364704 RepID=UPI00369F3495